MTLLINVVSKNFSIMSADKRVNIRDENRKTLSIYDNFNKIIRTKNNKIIIGISGNARNHKYIDKIKGMEKPEEVISVIKKFVYENNDISKALKYPEVEYGLDSGLCSFIFNNSFYTLTYATCLIESKISLFENDSKKISFFPFGSGFDEFKEIVETKEFKNKREIINDIDGINNKILKTKKLLTYIFEKVSRKNNSVSKEYFSYLSTKRKNEFKLMKSS